jgi:hypothetical protein
VRAKFWEATTDDREIILRQLPVVLPWFLNLNQSDQMAIQKKHGKGRLGE